MTFRGVSIAIPDVLVDTGAASTVLNADIAAEANVLLQHSDRLRVVRGVPQMKNENPRRADYLSRYQQLDNHESECGIQALTCVEVPEHWPKRDTQTASVAAKSFSRDTL